MQRLLFIFILYCGIACDNKSAIEYRSGTFDTCSIEKIFTFHRQILYKTKKIDVLSFGSKAVGRYLILYSDEQQELYLSVADNLNGKIIQTWVTDLDNDAQPEIIVATRGDGTGNYGDLFLYEAGIQELKKISLPPLPSNLMAVYKGNDSFLVMQEKIKRHFVSYQPDDPNASPSGDTIFLEYNFENDSLFYTLLP